MENISKTILNDLRVLEEVRALLWVMRANAIRFWSSGLQIKNNNKKLEDKGVCVENAHTNEN